MKTIRKLSTLTVIVGAVGTAALVVGCQTASNSIASARWAWNLWEIGKEWPELIRSSAADLAICRGLGGLI